MKTSTLVWVVIVVLVLGGGWYWFHESKGNDTDDMQAGSGQPTGALGVNGGAGQTNTGQERVTPVLTIAHDATLGDYLVADNGMTLYRYTKDTAGVSNCSGACATNWPPYAHTTAEPLVAADGVSGAIATIARADGSTQVTYKGEPLYFWKNDQKPGDATGQNVGGVWFVVKP